MIFPVRRSQGRRIIESPSGRIYMRPGRLSDWQEWATLREQSRAFLAPWEPTWPDDSLTKVAFKRRLRQNAHEWHHGTSYAFFAFRAADDRFLGGVTLSNVRRGVAQTGSLGYWVGEPYAGQGYMTEAVMTVIEFSFKELGLHRLEAACLPNNLASQRLLIKCRFSQQGYARQYLRINGKWQDHMLFDTLQADHEALRREPARARRAR